VTIVTQGPQCSALTEVASGESTRTMAPCVCRLCVQTLGATVRVEKIAFLAYFLMFLFTNFATIKKLYRNISVCIILILDDFSVQRYHLEKKQSPNHPDRQPAYISIHEPECSRYKDSESYITENRLMHHATMWVVKNYQPVLPMTQVAASVSMTTRKFNSY